MTDITRTLEILDKLVGFPTVSRDSNLDLIDWVQNLLQTAGFDVTRIWSPDRTKAGLFARIGPGVDGGVCLSAHTDVVPVDGQVWTRPPFQLTDEGDRVYGRGTTDMKGFLASALALAERARKTPLSAPLSLSISYDEEIGCVGIRQMMPDLKQLIGKPRLVIVGEPTSMQVATGHKGKTALKGTCHGQAGHSALAPQFVNAVHVAADFVHQIRQLQDQLAAGPHDDAYSIPYSTVHIGKITGGRALNIVPDSTQLDMEFRHLAQTPAQDIQREIEAVAHQVSRAYPSVTPITVETINAYPGLNIDPSDKCVAWADTLASHFGRTKVPFGTEAGFFAELGLKTVVIGPGDMASDGHKPDEGLSKTELRACDAMMDNILVS
ncbi:MAG: acetylornithine deacetylase [Hyphomicrobiales bacterium]|uniref:acetylornithine deacetylase n=1 Tax=Shimia thalassica TaxID=1715693 RepID=UPI00329A3673